MRPIPRPSTAIAWRSPRRHPRARRALRALVGGVGAAGIACAAILGQAIADLPSPDALVTRSSRDTTKILDRNGLLLYELLDPRSGRRTRVALAELPSHVVNAAVSVEDARFFEHPGVDARAVARAAWQLVRQGRVVSGASTITQQLARQVLLAREERMERTLRRKLREMVLAVRITRRFTREQILEMYLNEVYFGQLAYGIDAAARTYFGKPATELDLAESAMLVGLIQSPSAHNPLVDLDAARRRQDVVLRLMVRAGRATAAEADAARAEVLGFAGGNVPLEAPHFVAWVRGQLEARLGVEAVHRGGLHVVTTLDLDLQRQAEAVVARRMAELQRTEPGKPDHGASDAALVAIAPGTGQVMAMVGSADYFDEAIDGAVNVALALRQPGSAIKPLTYAAAFDPARWPAGDGGWNGPPSSAAAPVARPPLPFTAATVLSDVPTAFVTREDEPYRPMNYDRAWHGPLSLRRALATSSNMVAVKVLDAVGVGALVDTAEALGITTFGDRERYGLALTLGGGEVRLIELTAAYAGLANGGHRVRPEAILAVYDAAGWAAARADHPTLHALHARSTVDPGQAIPPEVAFLITDILADDAARLPAFGEGSVLTLGRPAAAKTGTTTDFRDNWTIGYTPDLAVGVWVGNADNASMAHISGITGAGPIWHDVMAAAHRGRPVRAFAVPAGLVRLAVCDGAGLLPTPDCQRRRMEWFAAGTEPTAPDPSYQAVAIDAATGLGWAAGCAGPRVERVVRSVPFDALDWARQAGRPLPPGTDCHGRPLSRGVEDQPMGLTAVTNGADGHAMSASVRDGRPMSMPADDASSTLGTAHGETGAPLVVTRPAPRAAFVLSPQLPLAFQRIEVAVALAGPVPLTDVQATVDGVAIALTDRPPYRASWAMAVGAHRVKASGRTADGRVVESPEVQFTVLMEETR